jgi:putrescine aminotransferase
VGRTTRFISFEQAMKCSRAAMCESFSRHVNPEEAGLLKMADLDKRYVRASGVCLYDESGRQYLDFTAGYGALNLGHNPPEVLKAVEEARSLPSVMLAGYNPLMGAVGADLAALLPGDLSVSSFGSGGAEAVEIAMKTALASTGRRKFLSCERAYHGLSLGALSLCRSERNSKVLGAQACEAEAVPFGDLNALETRLKREDIAAFFVEPIQGEGGAIVPPDGYLKGAEELCRKHGTLLVLDEIQTGFGRTGRMFALEHEKVEPDIVTLSKSLGAGVIPISVSVTSEDIWRRAFGGRDRFDLVVSTFGGNPAACAAALKSIEICLRDRLPERTAELGAYARSRLEELKARHNAISEVRGRGLLLGLALRTPRVPGANMRENYPAMVISRLLNKHGILTSYYDLDPTVVRFEPPLTVSREQIDQAIGALDETLDKNLLGLGLGFAKSVIGRATSGG